MRVRRHAPRRAAALSELPSTAPSQSSVERRHPRFHERDTTAAGRKTMRLLEAATGIRLRNGTAGVTKDAQQEGFLIGQKYDFGVQLEAAGLMVRYDIL
jgi:hypothetical protein